MNFGKKTFKFLDKDFDKITNEEKKKVKDILAAWKNGNPIITVLRARKVNNKIIENIEKIKNEK